MEKENLVTVTMRVEIALRDRLEQLAKADDRPLSNYIRVVLTEHVNQCESREAVAA